MSRSGAKTIVVTGVSRGLGRSMTDKFVALGHTVIGCSRSKETVADLRREYAKPHHFTAVDVSDNAAVSRWAKKTIADYGAPDLLINNAALINRNALLWDVPADEFSNVIDVNIKGVANVIRHFAPAMVERKKGVIVNFSSGWGRTTSAEVAPYCATKWAIEGLSRALAQELPRGMAAVPLDPGIINTDMLQSCFEESADHYPGPDEWAERAVPFLLKITGRQNGEPLEVPRSRTER